MKFSIPIQIQMPTPEQLPQALIIPKDDVMSVRELLPTLLQTTIILCTAIPIALAVGNVTTLWLGINILVSVAVISILARLNQMLRERKDQKATSWVTSLFLLTVTLYITLIPQPGSLVSGSFVALYALPIIGATLLITPIAGLIIGGTATAAFAIRLLLTLLFLKLTTSVTTILLTLSFPLAVAGIGWYLSHPHLQTRERLRRYIEQRQTSIEIGRIVSGTTMNVTTVAQQTAQLIQEAFGYYHVGVFVLDPKDKSIGVLTGMAGQAMSGQTTVGFRAPRTGFSVVAYAMNQKRSQIVTTWEEHRTLQGHPIQFTYERLPTRVELAIPLIAGDQVFGALDIHSIEVSAFPEEEVRVLEGVAGNIANALRTSQLFQEVQQGYQELSTLYTQAERRARYLEITARLSSAISSLREPQDLLNQVVHLISDGFGFYHTGIFLIDETREWAVLVAANSEGGQRMLARGHRLRIGEEGFVGQTTHTGQPHIGLDVGKDAMHFANPDLPDTRSEITLPLKVADQVIGALDVQSTQEAAFSEEDTAVLQALADQIAIAIENARLFQQTQEALEETRALQRYYVSKQWQQITRRSPADLMAEHYSLGTPRLETTLTTEMKMALEQERPIVVSGTQNLPIGSGADGSNGSNSESSPISALAVPIKLQDAVIGVLSLQELDEEREWSTDEIAMATAVADQLALALENARLVEETQRRAAQLAAAAEVARDATAILDVDQLLNETVHLISEQFGYYHAGVFLMDEANEYAVLRAASSERGKQMLARGHKLRIGKVGIVGRVAATGEPHIALDVGQDAVHFANPDLPDTRSEMGLPLRVRDQVIGVLDVQSTHEAAFSEENVSVLQTLADQLAAAIANARLFESVRAEAARRALINEVQQAATTSLDPRELLHKAGEVISRRLEYPSAVLLWDEESSAFIPVAVHDKAGDDIPLPQDLRLTRAFIPSLFSTMVEELRPTVLETQSHHLPPMAAKMAKQIGFQAAVGFPLEARGHLLGLLIIGQPPNSPTMDMEFAEIVARNLSVALDNANLYQQALETAERLREMDKLKSQFLANMSHELRTPLNSIIGFSRVILKGIDGPLTDMQRADLEAVYNSGQHLLGLINSILDISKIQAGKMELSIEDTDIGDIIRVVLSTAVALVKEKPIDLQQVIPDDLPIIQADPARIRQVLLNLVGNAAKFTEEGYIRIEAQATPTEVILTVSDTGIGIPEDKLDTIFEEFTQVDGSSTRRAGGTGLGLAITRHFIEMHGGRIWVESTLGEGSNFHVALPIAGPSAPTEEEEKEESEEAQAPTPMAEEVHVEPEPTGKPETEPEEPEEPEAPEKLAEEPSESDKESQRTVLCVDDDEGVIMLFRRYLGKQGYRVIGLTNGNLTLEKARQLHPFAITLDIMMPDRDGWQVIQDLKNDPETRHIPVIICTIVGEEGVQKGLSMGASDYLLKPILEDDLLGSLNRLERGTGPHRILIVDDQEEDRNLLRRIIESQPEYEVVEATGGQEAINLVHQIKPAIIILDLMMPEVDGFAVLEAVKSNRETRSIPIIVVTAKELTIEERERLNQGVASLLEKGIFQQQELLADVAAALQRIATQ